MTTVAKELNISFIDAYAYGSRESASDRKSMLRRATMEHATVFDRIYDAIVVLGDGKLATVTEGRIKLAADLFRSGDTRTLLLVGTAREVDYMYAAAKALGVPADAIRGADESDPRSITTLDNARNAARLLGHINAKDAAIITSDWHMERSLKTFEALAPLPFVWDGISTHDEIGAVRKLLENFQRVFAQVLYLNNAGQGATDKFYSRFIPRLDIKAVIDRIYRRSSE